MTPTLPPAATRRLCLLVWVSGAVATSVAACKTAPDAAPVPAVNNAEPPSPVLGPLSSRESLARISAARTPRAYRSDAASHVYALNPDRIYKGKMPPLLYAIGVLNIEIDRMGRITRLDWMRTPHHAPEVVAEIERTVRSAAPFPAPTRLGTVVYRDTWLWHKSGKFQLDTLTEGQN